MTTSQPDPQQPPSRRTLIKTAGTAAWTAPVIIAATAAPAMATTLPSATPAVITLTGGTTKAGPSFYTFSYLVTNTGSTPTTNLTISFAVQPVVPTDNVQGTSPYLNDSSSGYSNDNRVFGGVGSNGVRTTFTRRSSQLAGSSSFTIAGTFALVDASGQAQSGQAVLTVTADPGAPGTPGILGPTVI